MKSTVLSFGVCIRTAEPGDVPDISKAAATVLGSVLQMDGHMIVPVFRGKFPLDYLKTAAYLVAEARRARGETEENQQVWDVDYVQGERALREEVLGFGVLWITGQTITIRLIAIANAHFLYEVTRGVIRFARTLASEQQKMAVFPFPDAECARHCSLEGYLNGQTMAGDVWYSPKE